MYTFTLFLEMKYSDACTLTTGVASIHLSGQGLACDNPLCQGGPDVDDTLHWFLEEKNRPTLESSIDALYYTQHSFKHRRQVYEQLLTATELSVTDIERKSI
jgi:hypothetical protein